MMGKVGEGRERSLVMGRRGARRKERRERRKGRREGREDNPKETKPPPLQPVH